MDIVTRLFGTNRVLNAWLVASLVCNMGIVVTGAIVRLTGSGLGCPTWPMCSESSYVPHAEMGIHGVIEFGNRLLTFVLAATAIGSLIAAYKAGTDQLLRAVCWAIVAGVAAQAIVGGVTVRMQLNPWVVGIHLVGSVALIVACTWTVLRSRGWRPEKVSPPVRWLTTVVFVLTMVAIYLGTLVTGSGPHSGDADARRTGFDLELVAKVHAWSVWTLVALVVVALGVCWRAASRQSLRAMAWLFAAILVQGTIGYIQYFTHLPASVVVAHMIGTTVVTMLAATALFSNRAVA